MFKFETRTLFVRGFFMLIFEKLIYKFKTMSDILEQLIAEGEELLQTIKYIPPPTGMCRNYDVYSVADLSRHKIWLSSSQRFIRINYEEESIEVDNLVKEISNKTLKSNHQKILGVLKAIKLMPQKLPKTEKEVNPLVSIHNENNNKQNQSQEQTQSQSLVIEIFLEAIKDELTGKQQKEIREILEEHKDDPEKAKTKIVHKLASFGTGVLSSIVGNIITNPNLIGVF